MRTGTNQRHDDVCVRALRHIRFSYTHACAKPIRRLRFALVVCPVDFPAGFGTIHLFIFLSEIALVYCLVLFIFTHCVQERAPYKIEQRRYSPWANDVDFKVVLF